MTRLPSLGRCFFAIAMIAFGIQQLIHGDFVTRALPAWPAWFPARSFWVYLVGLASIAAGAGLFDRRFARRSALLLAAMIILSAVLLHVPAALANPPMWGALWTNVGKGLALGGGALIVAATVPGESRRPADPVFIAFGRFFLGVFLIFCGIEHFIFGQFVRMLVPAWIGAAGFWTYFSGGALIAGGAGLFVPRTARIAALLSGIMIFVWVWLLHLPRALADLPHPNEMTAFFEALAVSGIAFMLAGPPGNPLSTTPSDPARAAV